jgi:predicted neuraminidase
MTFESEHIFQTAPFRECHASTLVEVPSGNLLAAWFGGTREGSNDVGIWLAEMGKGGWSEPREVAREEDVPCWNPVLFRTPDDVVWLFYKVGVNPRSWSGAYVKSVDGGVSWSSPVIMPAGFLGPIKNKPILMSNDEVLHPTSVESYRAWTSWVEIMNVDGSGWERHGPICFPGNNFGLIQPSVVEVSPGKIRAFMRSTKVIGSVCVADSEDYGRTWSDARRTSLPNPNSGIDAVGLECGTIVMIYNHTSDARHPINAAISRDGGETWADSKVLEDKPGEYSYPAVIQASDGMIHTTYTFHRKTIKHCSFTEDWLTG